MLKRLIFFTALFFGASAASDSASAPKIIKASPARASVSSVAISPTQASSPARMSIGSYVKKQISSGVAKPIVSTAPSAPANNSALEKLEDELSDLKARIEDMENQSPSADLSDYWTIAEVEAELDTKQDSLPDAAGSEGKVLSVGKNGLEWAEPAGGGALVFTSDEYTE
jgi:TolA-binding protein